MKNCVYAGSFDPLTLGHEYIVEKCLLNYDRVFIVIGENAGKTCYFTKEERKRILESVYSNNERIEIIDYSSVKDNYKKVLRKNDVRYYVRGIRNVADRSYEDSYKKQNGKEYPFITTVYIDASPKLANVSSSLVREKIAKGEDISAYVSKDALLELKKILEEKNGKQNT